MSDLIFQSVGYRDGDDDHGYGSGGAIEKESWRDKQSTLHSNPIKQKILLYDDKSFASSEVEIDDKSKSDAYLRRLEKNRSSARKSRIKKKEHLNWLEDRSKVLSGQLEVLNKQLSESKMSLERYVNQHNSFDGFNIGRKQTYDRLAELIEDEAACDQDEINLLLNTLRFRVGATGRQRQGTLNYYFKKMIDICVPPVDRYLMMSAEEQIEMFNKTQTVTQINWTRELFSSLQLTKQQKDQILSERQCIVDRKDKLEQSLNNLQSAKNRLDQQSVVIENIVESLRNILTPVQSSKFILFIEGNKYKKEMGFWLENSSIGLHQSPIVKRVKVD